MATHVPELDPGRFQNLSRVARSISTTITFLIGVFALATRANGQILGHYPAGAEGIRAGSTPLPGSYTKLYNLGYWSDTVRNGDGVAVDPDFDAVTYLGALRQFYITDLKMFGADFGMDLTLPLISNELRYTGPSGVAGDSATGLGDILVQPLLLGRHGAQYDIGALYGVFLPTGDYAPDAPASPGKGFWTHMLGLGGTWYPDAARSWSLSLANRLEFHGENSDLRITPGDHYSFEWAVSKRLAPAWEAAITGYGIVKLTDDEGPGVYYNASVHDQVFGIGPELTCFFAPWKLLGSLRYQREFESKARPEGNALWLSLTYVW